MFWSSSQQVANILGWYLIYSVPSVAKVQDDNIEFLFISILFIKLSEKEIFNNE